MQTIGALCAIAAAAFAATAGASAGSAVRATPAATCPDLPQGRERVTLDPADFTTTIDNPWFPLRPGTRWVYRDTESRR